MIFWFIFYWRIIATEVCCFLSKFNMNQPCEWVKCLSHVWLLQPMDCSLTRFLRPWDFPGKNTGVGCHFLLQEIFPTQGLKPGLPHCRQMLYHLSHQGKSIYSFPFEPPSHLPPHHTPLGISIYIYVYLITTRIVFFLLYLYEMREVK